MPVHARTFLMENVWGRRLTSRLPRAHGCDASEHGFLVLKVEQTDIVTHAEQSPYRPPTPTNARQIVVPWQHPLGQKSRHPFTISC